MRNRLFTVAVIRWAFHPKVFHSQLTPSLDLERGFWQFWSSPNKPPPNLVANTNIYFMFHISTGWLDSVEWFSLSVLVRPHLLIGWAAVILRLHVQDGSHVAGSSCWLLDGSSDRLLPTAPPDWLLTSWWLGYNRELPTNKHFKEPKQKLQSCYSTSVLLPRSQHPLGQALIRLTPIQSGGKADFTSHWRRCKNLL